MKKFEGGKVTNLDTRSEFEKGHDTLMEALPWIMKQFPAQAQALKKKYDLLVEQGFTEAQAMEIVKSRPIWE
ncbi:hypothetical protein [Jeotgalibacillus terrae]|uniref:Phage protein n=1 Tax=Jeotgalibacillus terrae TaxID=587735 RepID=A0ABW5ZEV5_9BACL|nr:hypothetical protein [Jeotgalibacillus terrae]MBM7580037.1 hypothetical protein [Jeotgalibacillus terrae]